jgi:hypothetical protein
MLFFRMLMIWGQSRVEPTVKARNFCSASGRHEKAHDAEKIHAEYLLGRYICTYSFQHFELFIVPSNTAGIEKCE